MFQFSKWIRTSAEESVELGLVLQKVSADEHKPQASVSSEGLILPQGKHIPSKTGALMPSKGIFMDLDCPSLGKISRAVHVVPLPVALDFSQRIQENEKIAMGIAILEHRGSKSWEFVLGLGLTQLHRAAQGCLEVTRAGMSLPCDTEPAKAQGNGASR